MPCIGLCKSMCAWVCEWVCVGPRRAHTLSHTLAHSKLPGGFHIDYQDGGSAQPKPVRTGPCRADRGLYLSRVAEDWVTVGRIQALVFRAVKTPAKRARLAVRTRGPVGSDGVRPGAAGFSTPGVIYTFQMEKLKLAQVLNGVSMHIHTQCLKQIVFASEPNLLTYHLFHPPPRCPTRTSGPNWAKIFISPGVARMLLLFWNSTTFGESLFLSFSSSTCAQCLQALLCCDALLSGARFRSTRVFCRINCVLLCCCLHFECFNLDDCTHF